MNLLKFIHITKCAGTYIENIGKENNIDWGRFHKEYGFWHDIFIDKSTLLKEKYDWFVIVRNPYDRILSEYYCEWGGIGRKKIVHTKEDFNNYLIEKIKNRNLNVNVGHYREQYLYIDIINKYNYKINNKDFYVENLLFSINDFNNELITYINEIYDKDFLLFNYQKKSILIKEVCEDIDIDEQANEEDNDIDEQINQEDVDIDEQNNILYPIISKKNSEDNIVQLSDDYSSNKS